jgi:hypothetical protein
MGCCLKRWPREKDLRGACEVVTEAELAKEQENQADAAEKEKEAPMGKNSPQARATHLPSRPQEKKDQQEKKGSRKWASHKAPILRWAQD